MQMILSLIFLFLYFVIFIFIAFGAAEYFMKKGIIAGLLLMIPVLIIVFTSGNIFGIMVTVGPVAAMYSSISIAFILSVYILTVKSFEYFKKLFYFNKMLSRFEKEKHILIQKKDIISRLKLASLYEKLNDYEKALKIYDELLKDPNNKGMFSSIERNKHNAMAFIISSKNANKYKCKKCKKEIPSDRVFCPECGKVVYPLNPIDFINLRLKIDPKKFLLGIALIIMLFLIFTGIMPALTFLLMLFVIFSVIYNPFEGYSFETSTLTV